MIMCNCRNVDIGTYSNQVELKAPEWSSKETICIDACLKDEIIHLWNLGVKTTGCCCGHNKAKPFIGVCDESIELMKRLGYIIQYNPCNPTGEDSFYPKTINF